MIETTPLRKKLLDLAISGKLVPKTGEWKTVKLGDVGEWRAGATPPRNNSSYYDGGTIPWLKTGDLNDGVVTQIPESITQKALVETSVHLNPVGSVLIAMYGATIGKVGILGVEATTNQACCACRMYDCIAKEYLFYFLLANRDRFKKLGGGGAQPNISKQIIVNFPILLPPLAEQKAIVKRLEELLALEREIAADSAALDDLITAAKRRILDLAVSGKLVPKTGEPSSPNGSAAPGWKTVKLGEVIHLYNGFAFKQSDYSVDGKYNIINIGCVQDDCFCLESAKKIGAVPVRMPDYCNLSVGDVLISLTGNVGRTCVVTEKDCLLNQRVAKIVSLSDIDSRWFRVVLKTGWFQLLLEGACTGTAQKNLSTVKFLKLEIPLPPLAEQKTIVKRVEELFAVLDAMKEV